MKFIPTLALVLAAAAAPCAAQTNEPPPSPTPGAVTTAPHSPLAEDIIRLWKANLSEDFINKYVSHSALAKDLTADDVILLRNAGVPESLIASVSLGSAAPAPTDAPTGTLAGAPARRMDPKETRRWDGLARRNSGIVIFKSRWDPGYLEFKDQTFRWVDSKDASKNVLLPIAQVTEQQLACLKKPGGNECFEWVVKTRSDEYRFRDIAWQQGEDAKAEEIFAYLSGLYPNLISSRRPVDSK
ncbi:MAG: hypothetical protein ABI584_16085 [Acidobacteriota bacterium]